MVASHFADIEHLFPLDFAWEFSPTNSFATVAVNGHRLITCIPDVVDFLLQLRTTIDLAQYRSIDDIPTVPDLAYATLAHPSPSLPDDHPPDTL